MRRPCGANFAVSSWSIGFKSSFCYDSLEGLIGCHTEVYFLLFLGKVLFKAFGTLNFLIFIFQVIFFSYEIKDLNLSHHA